MVTNGEWYTKMPNVALDRLAGSELSRETRVLLVILRETFGWHRDEARLSMSQIANATRIDRRHVPELLAGLREKGIIIVRAVNQQRFYKLNPSILTDTISGNGALTISGDSSDQTDTISGTVTVTGCGDSTVTISGDTTKERKEKVLKKDIVPSDKPKVSAPVQQLFATYSEEYQRAHGRKPVIKGAQDGKAFKTLLAQHTLEDLQKWLVFYINSDVPFYRQVGWSIGIFYSQINGIIMASEDKVNGRKRDGRSAEEIEREADMERKFGGLGEKW